MTKEKPQPKNSDTPALEMARQTLGRAKEMDLTPKQKEKVMAMIKAARAEETAGDKSKALNLYANLKKYLEDITIISDKEKLGSRQISKVRNKIDEIVFDASMAPNKKKALVSALEKQIDNLEKQDNEKIEMFDGEFTFADKENFSAEQIMNLIADAHNINRENLFFKGGEVQDENRFIHIDIGIVADPSKVYRYFAAWANPEIPTAGDGHMIIRFDCSIEKDNELTGDKVVAYWDHNNKFWFAVNSMFDNSGRRLEPDL